MIDFNLQDTIEDVLKEDLREKGRQANKQVEYNIAVLGMGSVGRNTVFALNDIFPPKHSFWIENIYMASEQENLPTQWGRSVDTARGQDVHQANLRPKKYSHMEEFMEDVDISVITAASEEYRNYRSWTDKNEIGFNRNIMTVLNAPKIKDIAERFPEDYDGSVLVVTNEVGAMSSVFSQTSNVDPRRVVGLSQTDQNRLVSLIRKKYRELQNERKNLKGMESTNLRAVVENAYVVGSHSDPWPVLENLQINDKVPPPNLDLTPAELASDIQQHAKSLIGLEVGTVEETARAIYDTVTSIMSEEEITASSLYESENGGAFVTQPVSFHNFYAVPKDDGNWIKGLKAGHQEKIDQAISDQVKMLDLISGNVDRKDIRDEILNRMEDDNKGMSQSELEEKAEELSERFMRKMDGSLPSSYVTVPENDIERRETPPPQKVRVKPGTKNPEYENLGLSGKILLQTDGQYTYEVFKLEDFSRLGGFELEERGMSKSTTTINDLELRGRLALGTMRWSDRNQRTYEEVFAADVINGDVGSKKLQGYEIEDLVGGLNQINVLYTRSGRIGIKTFDVDRQSGNQIGEVRDIDITDKLRESGSQRANALDKARIGDQPVYFIGGEGTVHMLDEDGELVRNYNGLVNWVTNIHAGENVVLASSAMDPTKLHHWMTDNPESRREHKTRKGIFDLYQGRENLELITVTENKLRRTDLNSEDKKDTQLKMTPTDIHGFERGTLLARDNFVYVSEKSFATRTRIEIPGLNIHPHYVEK